ncbi:MAG: AAA domain-containing protein [Clostridia bacterium]|nr:AAA domain-containing protein [Clostridia bacterium]
MATYVNYDAGKLFAGKASGNLIAGYDQATEDVPPLRRDYIPQEWVARDLIPQLINYNEPIWISGPTGCGKTLGVKWVAARLRYPVFEITATPDMSASDLFGHIGLENGETVWVDGALACAMKQGGIFLLNEIDYLQPSLAAGLNTVLDGSPLRIPDTGEVIVPEPGFKFIATANTNGNGDISGLYVGTNAQNMAFVNRFINISASYVNEKQEMAFLIKAYPNLDKTIISYMVKLAGLTRKALAGEKISSDYSDITQELTTAISTRSLMRWAKQIEIYKPLAKAGINVVEYALERSVTTDSASMSVLKALLQRVAGSTK